MTTTLDPDAFDALTFDCYGTLIDWESGILGALEPVLERHGIDCGRDELLRHYGAAESALQAGEYRSYRTVLAGVMDELGRVLGFTPSSSERDALGESLANWPAFPDTVDALTRLARHVRLGIVSNIDDDLFAHSHGRLGDHFTWIVTAASARAYKPALAVFEQAERRLAVPRARWLHAGQSVFHDVVPGRAFGLTTVLVERRGSGATRPVQGEPHYRVPDMAALAALLGV